MKEDGVIINSKNLASAAAGILRALKQKVEEFIPFASRHFDLGDGGCHTGNSIANQTNGLLGQADEMKKRWIELGCAR